MVSSRNRRIWPFDGPSSTKNEEEAGPERARRNSNVVSLPNGRLVTPDISVRGHTIDVKVWMQSGPWKVYCDMNNNLEI
jgi:hypothetical protein